MDVAYPYAGDDDRRALLYRLPSIAPTRRLLVVGGDSGDWARHWGGPVTLTAPALLGAVAVQQAGAFDAVAFPGTLTSPPDGTDATTLLRDARGALAPGGLVIGHVRHALALRPLATAAGRRALWRTLSDPRHPGTPRRCLQMLVHAGYVDLSCYFVQPDLSAPMGLVPWQGPAARAHFIRAVWSAQGHHGRAAFAARWLLAVAGLAGLQQQDLFYWARTPC